MSAKLTLLKNFYDQLNNGMITSYVIFLFLADVVLIANTT